MGNSSRRGQKKSQTTTSISISKNGKYKIKLHPDVIAVDSKLFDAKQKEKIKEKCISLLSEHPNDVGEPLQYELKDLKIGNNFRIVYRVDDDQVIVFILAVGIRKEEIVYDLAKGRIRK